MTRRPSGDYVHGRINGLLMSLQIGSVGKKAMRVTTLLHAMLHMIDMPQADAVRHRRIDKSLSEDTGTGISTAAKSRSCVRTNEWQDS